MSTKKQYCVISHTHWDREWYLPLENFRMRLVDLIDNLLDIIEADPEYRFHLDAQTIVLQDYLEIRPYKKELLEKLIASGNILVGPWYVQNDFHLTSGEATVRNLIIGSKIANDFGGCMKIGYAADQFGLISQLPQILNGFDLDTCIFGRGFDRGVTEFYWDTEDGSRVLCEHMKFWYNNAQRFPDDPARALMLARQRGDLCARFDKTSNHLLMNGVDHLEAQEDLMPILRGAQSLLEEGEAFYQDTMPEFMARVKAEAAEKGVSFDVFKGEFRDNGADNCLTGTLSSRIHLKVWNAWCQSYLEKKLEPLYATIEQFGLGNFPLDWDHYLWKVLIQNHPHDSICGCSVDPVHNHMEDRFERIEENVTDLFKRGTTTFMSHLDRTGLNKDQSLVLVYNPTQLTANDTVVAKVTVKSAEDTGCFTLTDAKGKEIPFVVEKIETNVTTSIHSPINLPGGVIINRYTIRIPCGKLAPMSYQTLIVTPCEGKLEVAPIRKRSSMRMENDFIKVQINKNGTCDITDKKTGAMYAGAFLLSDTEDWGDSYNYVPNPEDVTITSENVKAKIEVLCDNELIQQRRISYGLAVSHKPDSGVIPFEMVLTVEKGNPVLGVNIKLTNTVKEHRLRILVPTGIVSDQNYAGQPYDCIIRDKVSRFRNDKDHPNTDYVGVEDGTRGVALLNLGIYEYEQMEDEKNTLALTLVRATSAISCSHSGLKSVEEGWMTPGGEMLGRELKLTMAVYPYAGDHLTACVAQRAAKLHMDVWATVQSVDINKFAGGRPFVQGPGMPDLFYRPLPHPEVVLPLSGTTVKLKEDKTGAMVFSAFKGAECGEGKQIFRLFNTCSEEVTFTLTFTKKLKAVHLARMDETALGDSVLKGAHTVTLTAKPKQVITLKLSM